MKKNTLYALVGIAILLLVMWQGGYIFSVMGKFGTCTKVGEEEIGPEEYNGEWWVDKLCPRETTIAGIPIKVTYCKVYLIRDGDFVSIGEEYYEGGTRVVIHEWGTPMFMHMFYCADYEATTTTTTLPSRFVGTVVDVTTNTPLPSATVSWKNMQFATTDSMGNYIIENLVSGTGTMSASKSGYLTDSKTITAPASGDLTVLFGLMPIVTTTTTTLYPTTTTTIFPPIPPTPDNTIFIIIGTLVAALAGLVVYAKRR